MLNLSTVYVFGHSLVHRPATSDGVTDAGRRGQLARGVRPQMWRQSRKSSAAVWVSRMRNARACVPRPARASLSLSFDLGLSLAIYTIMFGSHAARGKNVHIEFLSERAGGK